MAQCKALTGIGAERVKLMWWLREAPGDLGLCRVELKSIGCIHMARSSMHPDICRARRSLRPDPS